MIELNCRIAQGEPTATLTLPYDKRQRSRMRAMLDDGRDVGIFLERGTTLRNGDLLSDTDGMIVRIAAAAEPVSEVRCDDSLLLARACYHLGNRHVALQIDDGVLRYLHDHVLDNMVRGLGLAPRCVEAPFEPEPGAYGGGHAHSHAHHDHGHDGHAH
ncbi:urease accessory protein UreE [Thiosocius teredinicola]|uniref:urease accessory protein UreE n=1 Tax=Thiosocius teredinicola TaxID=1973002 RepID=UPI0009911F4F